MGTPPEVRDLVARWFGEIFTLGDEEAVDEIVAVDLVAHAPGDGPVVQGPTAFKEWLRWYRAAFTDAEWTVHDVISEGDRVAVRYSGRTTYRGGLLGIPSSNQRVVESGILILRLENGRVREIWPEMSDLQVVMQLGAFPAG